MMALSSAASLVQALPLSVGIVRPDNVELQASLMELGMAIHTCEFDEMSASLGAGIRHGMLTYPVSTGVVIALADMPYILTETIFQVAEKLDANGGIVVPTYQGRRGHPVGFSAKFYDELQNLAGDKGARELIERNPSMVTFLEVDDPGILLDIDTPGDVL